MPGDARGSVCVAAICRYTSLVCSVVQEYGAAARCHHSKWRHDSAPMNQNSTAAHRPVVLMTTAPDTALWPPDYPDRDSDRDATSHPRDENPASQSPPDGKHPGTACNSPSPRAQSAARKDVAHSGTCESPPANQPPRQITLHLQPPVGLTQPGQTTGVAVDQRHNLTLHLCPQPVLRRHPEIRLRLTGDIHAGKISFPLRCSHHEAARLRWRTSPGVRQNR